MVQRVLREGTLIVYFLLALYLLIALFSYSPADPGFTTTGDGGEVSNAVGVYGAWIADILLHLFGYLAFGFPGLLAYKVYTSFREEELEAEFSWPMFGIKTMGFILLMIAACALATLHFEVSEQTPYIAGGVLGSIVVDISVPMLATLGSTLLYLAIFLFGLTITATISWLDVIDRVGSMTLNMVNTVMTRSRKWLEERKQELATRERLESRKKVLDIHIEKERKRVPPTITAPSGS